MGPKKILAGIGLVATAAIITIELYRRRRNRQCKIGKKRKNDYMSHIKPKLEGSKGSPAYQQGRITFLRNNWKAWTRKLPSNSCISDPDTKKLAFQSGNPFVEVTKGILHFYKEDERTPLTRSDGALSEMLLMMAVPPSISCRDLLQFVAPFQADIEHIKIIRDSSPNQYMVLIKFIEQTLNGTSFNSLEDDLCNLALAYVARVEAMKESENIGLPLVGHTELPTCPVCLERMDESVDGILTIFSNHTFHSICVSKWSAARYDDVMLPNVSLCVLLIEVDDDSTITESLSYLAPKYRGMASSGKGGKGELVFGRGEKKKTRGLRVPTTLAVETYSLEDSIAASAVAVPSAASAVAHSTTSRESISDPDTKKLAFQSGNPFVEVTKGILHFYKEDERTPLTKSDGALRSEMLLMMAVPATISCRDLLQFVAPFYADIEHIKIIRDSSPNQYMVLIKFMDQTIIGTSFYSFEDDLCNLAYVARVGAMKESENIGLPLVGHTELPTCPVCLERMDESVDGVLTILCNHTFPSICLSKWSDARCRYVQTPELVTENQCCECKSSESLWICLICGHIGCGRYVQGHAFKHFCETSHCYAIQPDNNRVWDYIGDNFVHRLLQNNDGKLVEVGTGGHRRADMDTCDEKDEKLESIKLEFTYMLTTQLESQRFYFEERLASHNRDMQREMEKMYIRIEESDKYKEDMDSKFSNLSKERVNLEKIAQLNQKMVKVTGELKEEKAMNTHLHQDKDKWQEMVTKLETEYDRYVQETTAEIADLKEQLRDIMFFFEAQKKIDESPLKEGENVTLTAKKRNRVVPKSNTDEEGSKVQPEEYRRKLRSFNKK